MASLSILSLRSHNAMVSLLQFEMGTRDSHESGLGFSVILCNFKLAYWNCWIGKVLSMRDLRHPKGRFYFLFLLSLGIGIRSVFWPTRTNFPREREIIICQVASLHLDNILFSYVSGFSKVPGIFGSPELFLKVRVPDLRA